MKKYINTSKKLLSGYNKETMMTILI